MNHEEEQLLTDIQDAFADRSMPYKKSPGDRDLDMRRMATDREAEVVCRFCRWLKRKQDMPAVVDEYSDAAIDIWCTRS